MVDIDGVAEASRDHYDISSPDDHGRVRAMADDLLAAGVASAELEALGRDSSRNLDLRLATRLAASKRLLDGASWAHPVAVVLAMWGERRRLRPASAYNPTGEDALHVKLDQLDWLLGETGIDWRLYAVDDGDPEDSAAVAEERAALHERGDRVSVLRLSDAVPARSGPLAGLAAVDDSRKGGAIVHGAASALVDGHAAVITTDADNSVDLGQIGLLLAPHAAGAEVVIGDRKHPDSVLLKAEARWGPGIVVLRHMQRMIGRSLFERGLNDTQAAFKLFGRTALVDILAAPSTYGFSFDSDWLYAAIANDRSIERVPFGFVDSFEESASITQGPMTTWESLLRGLVEAARARGVEHDEAMAAVVDDLADAPTLERVVQRVPDELKGVPADRLGDPNVMSPDRLRAWIEGLAAVE